MNKGSFSGATPGTTHFAVGAFGYPAIPDFSTGAVKDRASTPAAVFASAAAKDRLRGSLLIGASSDHAVNTHLLDAANVMKTSALIHTGVAPANGDTVLSSFWLGRRTSVGNTIAPASTVVGFPGQLSIAGLRKISLALTINYSNAWIAATASDVLLRSRLYYKLFTLQAS